MWTDTARWLILSVALILWGLRALYSWPVVARWQNGREDFVVAFGRPHARDFTRTVSGLVRCCGRRGLLVLRGLIAAFLIFGRAKEESSAKRGGKSHAWPSSRFLLFCFDYNPAQTALQCLGIARAVVSFIK